MSLVVALIEPEFIVISGDTRLVKYDEPVSNIFNGSLMVVVISKFLCVAYSGNSKYGENTIKTAIASKNFNEVVQILKSASEINDDGESDASFIVASSASDNRCLKRIVEGKVTTITGGEAWIGDGAAYMAFQQHLNNLSFSPASPGVPDFIHKKSRFTQALSAVINDESIVNVGDIQVTASDDGKGLMYMYNFNSIVGNASLSPGMNKLPFSTGPGTDSMLTEVLTPKDVGVGAICVYVHEAEAGAIYAPTLLEQSPQKVEADSVTDFIQKVQELTDVNLIGSGFN